MKPEYVKMQAFGSYLKPTLCDFTALYSARLFLITGPTGGGKTTILDAMSFALYGSATGDSRDFRDMRCLSADDSTDTFAEFVFSLGNKRYRFVRTLHVHKKRTGEIEYRPEAECHSWGGEDWELMASGVTEVSKKAQEILGFTHDQFSQVIVLPQGEFRKLLLAKSEDKAKILQVLFGTGVWKRCADYIGERRRSLDAELKGMKREENALLGSENCGSFEDLCTLVENSEKDLSSVEELRDKALAKFKSAADDWSRAAEIDKDFSALEKARLTEETLKKSEGRIKEYRERLETGLKVKEVLPFYKHRRDAEKSNDSKKAALAAARFERERCGKIYDSLTERMKNLPAAEETEESLRQEITELNALLPEAKQLKELELKCRSLDKTAAELKTKSEETACERDNTEKRISKGEQIVSQLQEEYIKAAVANSAAELARQLKINQPCPVCGSLHHPAVAAKAEHPTSELMQKLKKYQERLSGLKSDFEKQRQAAERVAEEFRNADRELAVALEKYKDAKLRLGENGGYDSIAAALREKTAGAEKIKKEISELKTGFDKAHADYLRSDAASLSANRIADDAAAELEKASDELSSAALSAGFPADADFAAMALSREDEEKLKAVIKQYENSCTETNKEIQLLSIRLKDKPRPDMKILTENKENCEKAASEAGAAAGRAKERRDRLQGLLKSIEQLRQSSGKLDKEYGQVTKISNYISGSNESKTPLHSFVLGLMLDDVIAAATRFLRRLSRERFSLIRADYSGSGRGNRGLDIEVIDSYSGGQRKVGTLSGGEQFLASLSLAFGLAEVVQAGSGGVYLDSIFIDEGFGSLDTETLEAAMKALDDIRGEGRLVGIISHVSELRSRIPARIEVSCGDEGSSLLIKGI